MEVLSNRGPGPLGLGQASRAMSETTLVRVACPVRGEERGRHGRVIRGCDLDRCGGLALVFVNPQLPASAARQKLEGIFDRPEGALPRRERLLEFRAWPRRPLRARRPPQLGGARRRTGRLGGGGGSQAGRNYFAAKTQQRLVGPGAPAPSDSLPDAKRDGRP